MHFGHFLQLKNEESKLALLQIEKVKWKRGVEMKNLELVELKKRFETFSIEKVSRFVFRHIGIESVFLFTIEQVFLGQIGLH